MKTDLGLLEERVKTTLKDVAFKSDIRDYHVEEGQDDDGIEFLRVIFDLSDDADIPDEKLNEFAQEIEKTLGEVDERFASVRFSEAA
jgi:hypothetical protein